eukprot:2792367-Ditylum_brightwellii.AAC.1
MQIKVVQWLQSWCSCPIDHRQDVCQRTDGGIGADVIGSGGSGSGQGSLKREKELFQVPEVDQGLLPPSGK